jgi:molybdenum cofactor guanylyltransferase
MRGKNPSDTAKPLRPAIILAGGQSLRMGGGQKALMPLGDMRVIDHVLARLRPQCSPIALSANGDPALWQGVGLELCPDSLPDYPGPLAGILEGMEWAAALGANHVLSVAADTPFFPRDLFDRLCGGGDGSQIRLASTLGAEGREKIQPTFGLWPVRLRSQLRQALLKGERKVGLWAMENGATTVSFASATPPPFFNINHPDDLAQAETYLEQAPVPQPPPL